MKYIYLSSMHKSTKKICRQIQYKQQQQKQRLLCRKTKKKLSLYTGGEVEEGMSNKFISS
jgi:hypothetical protein